MKHIYSILLTASGTLLLNIAFGQKEKVCQPLFVTFENFKKKTMNLSAGIGMSRTNVQGDNYFSFNGQLGINYFPINHLEVGMRVRPTHANNKVAGKNTLLENNLYVRYYPLFHSCLKLAVLTGASVYRDGANYSVKGEPISKNKISPSLNAGFIAVPKKALQFELYSDFFFDRPARHNIALVWTFKSFKLN